MSTADYQFFCGDDVVKRITLSLLSGGTIDLSTTKIVATLARGSTIAATIRNSLAGGVGLVGIVAVAPAATSMQIDCTWTAAQTALLTPVGGWTLEVVIEGADGLEHTAAHKTVTSLSRQTPAIVAA